MVDPTSDLNEDVDEDEAATCTTCGATLVDASDHRVVTWVDENSVQTEHFCDDTCRQTWDDERA